MLCDPRLRTRGYGRLFLDSLPPATVATDVRGGRVDSSGGASRAPASTCLDGARRMKILALDTATEACSVALLSATRRRPSATKSSGAVMRTGCCRWSMSCCAKRGLGAGDLDAIAFGRGPGRVHGPAHRGRRRAGSRVRQRASGRAGVAISRRSPHACRAHRRRERGPRLHGCAHGRGLLGRVRLHGDAPVRADRSERVVGPGDRSLPAGRVRAGSAPATACALAGNSPSALAPRLAES